MNLRFNYPWLCLLPLVALIILAASTQQVSSSETGSGAGETTDKSGGDGRFRNVLSLLLRPIKATIKRARSFLGHRIEDVTNGIDEAQVEIFKIFMHLYNKTYPPEEIPSRMLLFLQRRKFIQESIEAYNAGLLSFSMRENAYADWRPEELKTLAGTSIPQHEDDMDPEEIELMIDDVPLEEDISSNSSDPDPNLIVRAESIPASKDWRQSGCVSKPIDQLKCGACYAISTMSALETMRCLNRVSAPILSSQQVVDCSTPRAGYGNHGCNGGWPTKVLRYLQDVGVAARETCYPFERRQNSCRLRRVRGEPGCTVASSPSDIRLRFKVLSNERDILYHVAKTGPVITVIRATDRFLYYDKGIFDDRSCTRSRRDVDHAIVIVGYGSQNGQDYWLIKNSWGTDSWGQNGYGKIRRGKNACSIGHWGWAIVS